jgi:hypothetical protein
MLKKSSFFQLYNNSVLSHQVSKDVLRDLVEHLITLLVNGHMGELESGESYIRIINTLVLRVIERSDHTNITWWVKCFTGAWLKIPYSFSAMNSSPFVHVCAASVYAGI